MTRPGVAALNHFCSLSSVLRPLAISSQGRQALNWVERHARVAPRTAGVVNAERLVHFNLARHCFGRRERDFAERDTNIGMQFAGNENLFRIRKLTVRRSHTEK